VSARSEHLIRDVLARYEVSLAAAPTLSRATRRAYRSRVSGFLAWLQATPGGGDPLADARAARRALERYCRHLAGVAGCRPATVNATLTAVDHLYRTLGLGPAGISRAPGGAGPQRAIGERERRRFLRAADGRGSARDRALALTLLCTGVRVTELVALDCGDVAGGAHAHLLVRAARPPRAVPLHPRALAALRSWLRERPTWSLAERSPALFLNRRGGRLSTRSVDEVVAGISRDAGLEGRDTVTPRALRHGFAARLQTRGVDAAVVAELMGAHRRGMPADPRGSTVARRELAIAGIVDG
jgi:integrase/recombinase XerC